MTSDTNTTHGTTTGNGLQSSGSTHAPASRIGADGGWRPAGARLRGSAGLAWLALGLVFAAGCGESSCPAGSVSMGARCVDQAALEGDGGLDPDQSEGTRDASVTGMDATADAATDAATDANGGDDAALDAATDADSSCPTGFEPSEGGCARNPCVASADEPAACDPNASCASDSAGDVECVCNDGYIGDGATCVKDGCASEPNAASPCGANETCTPDEEGAPSCACAAGFADCNESVSDGCEVALDNNAAHCGACGFACAAGLACNQGVCAQRVTHIGMGWGTGLFRRANGDLLGAGGALSANPASSRTPVKVAQTGVLRAYPYYQHTCATRGETQSALCWGINDNLQVGAPSTGTTSFELGEPARSICAGEDYSCMVTLAGTVRCWGSGQQGAFGNNTNYTTVSTRSFADSHPVLNVTGATDVVCGLGLSCALTDQGRVYCWGTDATSDIDYAPELVRDVSGTILADAVGLSGGNAHACAVREGGTAVCWGSGANGRLGDAAPAVRSRYVTVPLSDVTSVSAGALHTCALLSDGGVRCWGGGANGGLGSGDVVDQPLPVEPLLPEGYVATAIYSGPLAAGACVTLTTGQVYCWGFDYYGQLGVNGQATFQATPLEVTAWP